MAERAGSGESSGGQHIESGGLIAELARPAFTLTAQPSSRCPVLIAVPHAGRAYPPAIWARLRRPETTALRLEDRYVDAIGRAVAERTGAALLIAHAPRAMIDLNRASDDIDRTMIAGSARRSSSGRGPSERSRRGIGLFPRRLPGIGELWSGSLCSEEADRRIADIHAPYHAAARDALRQIRSEHGAALLFDLHSMPSLPRGGDGAPGASYVIGDRFGASCDSALVSEALKVLALGRVAAACNRPYAGGYALETHGRPRQGLHAMQLEIDRACYLDGDCDRLGPGLHDQIDLVANMVSALSRMLLARGVAGWAQAAE